MATRLAVLGFFRPRHPLKEELDADQPHRWTHSEDTGQPAHAQDESSPTERVLARVCREAGARVKFNAFLRDMNLGIETGGR